MSILEVIDYCVFCRAKECNCDPTQIEIWQKDIQKYYDAIQKRYNECSWCKKNKQKMNTESFACGHFQCKMGSNNCEAELMAPTFSFSLRTICANCFYNELDVATAKELMDAEKWTIDMLTNMRFPFKCKNCNERLYGQGQRTIIHICKCGETKELCGNCYFKDHLSDEDYGGKTVKVFRSCMSLEAIL